MSVYLEIALLGVCGVYIYQNTVGRKKTYDVVTNVEV